MSDINRKIKKVGGLRPARHAFKFSFPNGDPHTCCLVIDGKKVFPSAVRFEADATSIPRVTLVFHSGSVEIEGNADVIAHLRETASVLDFLDFSKSNEPDDG